MCVQDLFDAISEGPYNAIYVLGSAGCGKSWALKQLHRMGEQRYGKSGAAHCANSGRVAVNVGGNCMTFGTRLKYGAHRPHEAVRYTDLATARGVADVKLLLVEEATAIPNRLFDLHLAAMKDAKMVVNDAAQVCGQPSEYPDIDAPVHGVKLVATGDYLQQIVGSAGVGQITEHGRCHPYFPPRAASTKPWRLSALQHDDANVLVVIGHGNKRLLSKMYLMLATGCDSMSECVWYACFVVLHLPTQGHPPLPRACTPCHLRSGALFTCCACLRLLTPLDRGIQWFQTEELMQADGGDCAGMHGVVVPAGGVD